MTPERQQQVELLVHAARERDPKERSALLAEACGADEELRREVESRLRPAGEIRGLVPGAQLGPYQVGELLGAGGMGQVYRASDPRLRREVAIKISTIQWNERSTREARLVASLNHPNICQVYDVGPNYLVMELVEGPTLAERLARGPVPMEEALGIARQIGEALEAAHEKGIVHRDLKPGNVKIRPDGTVKVLDFGLGKSMEAATAGESAATMTLEPETGAGAIMGTAGYMAPEQARGLAVDKRADIWAFGVVLYEMFSGQRLFQGASVPDTLAAVLTKDPEWERVPRRAQRLVRQCLERDPKRRLRDIGDARLLLEDGAGPAALPGSAGRGWKIGAAVLALGLAVAIAALWRAGRHETPALLRLSVDFGEDAALSPRRGSSMALAPDGSKMVFTTGQPPDSVRLAMRRLDQVKATPLAGTEGAEAPFFSPDGKSIAFFADGKLKRMDAAGGAPVTVCDAPRPREGSWGDDDQIVVAANNLDSLYRVPASGGTLQPVTRLDKTAGDYSHRFPQVLPGARGVLFTNSTDQEGDGRIEAVNLQTGKRNVLVAKGTYGRYLPGGHLVYLHAGTLFAAPMDREKLVLTGAAVPVLEDVYYLPSTGAGGFTFSKTGMFAYVARAPDDHLRPIGMLGEDGKMELLPLPKARYVRARISPDGKRLALAIATTAGTNIWIYEFESQRMARFALTLSNSSNPIWSPDGRELVFTSEGQAAGAGIYWMRSDGSGEPARIVEGTGLIPTSFSAQGGLLYQVEGRSAALWRLPMDFRDGAHPTIGAAERFADPGMESPAAISPDGRWLAYMYALLGQPEVFVRPFPGAGGPWQISNLGTSPVWSGTRRQLFYRGVNSRIIVADYSVSGDSFTAQTPRPWSEVRVERFDLMPDGKRAVVVPAADQTDATHATFLLNFNDELKARVGAK